MTEHSCWWLVAVEGGETTLVFGSDKSEADARQHGLEILAGTNFDVKKLPTRNLGRASSLLKGDRLEKLHSLKEAKKRLHHTTIGKKRIPRRPAHPSSGW